VSVILGNKVLDNLFCDLSSGVEREPREPVKETPFGSNGDRIESVTGIVSHKVQGVLYQGGFGGIHRWVSLCVWSIGFTSHRE
jgi:hypothetical protein